MGRRILNRKEMRADFDAAERRKDEEVDEEEEEGEDDDDEEGDEEEGEGDAEEAEEADGEESDEGGGDEDDEDAPKKKKKKKPAKAPKPPKAVKPKTRTRAAKIVRMRVVWGVFNNSNQCVATYEYPKKQEAEARVAQLTADKRSTHFLQPVKEPIEEKKEK